MYGGSSTRQIRESTKHLSGILSGIVHAGSITESIQIDSTS